ncbi:hypothetical protein [Ketobacter sp.]|uniref:hypothetical protein n=1 Tax=Ketobacter sp. TaxID=2083498 RepID=UPI000F1C7FDE|nr:hypothetical protein [Ketobacter sp.]RLT98074.1 MAG: hypothetical protein D9N14_10630 [Ketobacter sp.]
MSTELIIILSIVGGAGLIGLFYISHSIEKQRRQRALLIANLSDHAFRLQRILDSVPAAYTGKDIQLLLLGQIKKRMERLKDLAPGNEKFHKKLESTNAQIAEVTGATTPQTKPQLKCPEEANEIRTQLQDLSKVIEGFTQNKVISVDEARRYLSQLQSSFIDANLNYLLQVAENTRRENKPKLAILNYEKALAEMKKRNQKGAYDERMAQIGAIINELKIEAGHQVEEDTTENNELTQAMDEMIEEEDAWKKKYF